MSAKKKKPRGKPFAVGEDERRLDMSQEQPKETASYNEPPNDGASPYLQDLRHVHLNAKSHDRTEPQKTARLMKAKNPHGFWALLASLEKEHEDKKTLAARKEVGVEEVDDRPDPGSDAAMEMCRQILRDMAEKAKGET